jgi:hypothetical protein
MFTCEKLKEERKTTSLLGQLYEYIYLYLIP